MEITYHYDFEAFLKILGSKLCGKHKLAINYPTNTLYLTKNNLHKICEQILHYSVSNGLNAQTISTLVNPVAKKDSKINSSYYITGLSVLAASFSYCKNDNKLSAEDLFSQITLIQEFPPNFFLQILPQDLIFFWYLDELHEILHGINDDFINNFLEKFMKRYTQGISGKYHFSPIANYNMDYLKLPGSVDPWVKPLETIWQRKLYGYSYEKCEYFWVKHKNSEPQTLYIKPYSIEKFFHAVDCVTLPK